MPFSDPSANLAQLGLKPGAHVADFGAGSGFYSLAAAKAVGNSGKVYAVEVQKDLLDRIKNTASHEGIHNIEVVWGDFEKQGGTRLRDRSMDALIISNVLFQAEDKSGLADEARRVLKSAGKALVIDWSDSSDLAGPDAKHVVAEADARAIFEKAGFSVEKGIQAGAHHYGFVAVKS